MMQTQQLELPVLQRADNGGAFRQLYDETHKVVYRIALNLLKNEHDAWDATQNVYVKILLKLDTLREPDKLRSWMVALTYNECRNLLKARACHWLRNSREADISDTEYFPEMESPELNPVAVSELDEMKAELKQLMEQLPAEQQQVLALFYYQQKSIDEIAALTGCSAGTVKSRLNYAKKKMRRLVGDYESRHHVTLRCSFLFALAEQLWSTKAVVAIVSTLAMVTVGAAGVVPPSAQPGTAQSNLPVAPAVIAVTTTSAPAATTTATEAAQAAAVTTARTTASETPATTVTAETTAAPASGTTVYTSVPAAGTGTTVTETVWAETVLTTTDEEISEDEKQDDDDTDIGARKQYGKEWGDGWSDEDCTETGTESEAALS